MGIGDWGLGIGDWAQSPIPNPHKIILLSFIINYLLNKKNIQKMENSKKILNSYSEEISAMHCNLCNSNLVLKYINQNQRIILCSNKSVIK